MKALASVNESAPSLIVIETEPAAFAGVVQVSEVLDTTEMLVQALAPKRTWVLFVKLTPMNVTVVPPEVGPDVGVRDVNEKVTDPSGFFVSELFPQLTTKRLIKNKTAMLNKFFICSS